MDYGKIIFEEFNKWVYNDKNQAGDKLQVIDVGDLHVIITNIVEKIDVPGTTKDDNVQGRLISSLNDSIEEYVKIFEKKHEIKFDFWIAEATGTVACFGDYFVSFEDIRLDLEKNVDNNVFFEWYDLSLELGLKDEPIVNYQSYLRGYRPI